jgi:predicted RNase H-like HicB family nuclease
VDYCIIVEKHFDGYVAYPRKIEGVVVGQGDTYEEALSDARSAIQFHVETFALDTPKAEESRME